MKILLTAILLLLASPAGAMFYLGVGSEDGDTSYGLGLRGERFGFEVGFIQGGLEDKRITDYPAPHDNVTQLGTHRINSEMGFDLLTFYPVHRGLELYAGGGIYWGEFRRLAQSNFTGIRYTEEEETRVSGAYSVGAQWRFDSWLLGAGYHNRRGLNFQLGWSF